VLLIGIGAFGLYQLFGPAGKSVAVPDVVGSTPAEADAELKKADLIPRFENVSGKAGDTVGTVVKQTPTEGASVPARSVVTLEVNVGPATAKIPDNLVGKDIDDVRETLEEAGFTSVKADAVRDDTGRADPGEVLSIDPDEGKSAALDQDVVIRYVRAGGKASEPAEPSKETSETPDPEPTPSSTEPTETDEPTDEPEPSSSTEPSKSPEPSQSARSSGSPRSGKLPKPSTTPTVADVP
jgi:serine/threonine-protein kinase